MEVDSSLKESSGPKAEDGQISKATEPKHLKDSTADSSVYCSAGNQLSLMASSGTPSTDNESLQKVLTESPERQVEKMYKMINSEDSLCTVATASLQNESDGERSSLNQAAKITPESRLSTREEHTNQMNSKLQCNSDHEVPEANCDYDGVRQVSDPVQQVTTLEECPDKDHSVQRQSEVKENVPGYSLQISPTPHPCSKTDPERTIEEIQSVSSPVNTATDLKKAEDQNSHVRQDSDSSCTEMNGVTSEDSSDEEEFLSLKRKVRGICTKPADLDRVTSNKLLSNKKQESLNQVHGINNETKQEHLQPENEKDDGGLTDGDVSVNRCKPVILEDDAGEDVKQEPELTKTYKHKSENNPNSSIPILDAQNHQEECVLSGSIGPNTENLDDGLKEDGAKTKGPSVNSQDIYPALSVNEAPLSNLDESMNLPLTDDASRNALTSTPSPESIGKVLTEMGPPLPPVVLPLTATPPQFRKHLTQNRPSIQLPTWSSTEGPFSLKQHLTLPSPDPGVQDEVKTSIPQSVPSPSRGVPSSPLQFGSATPKHALPVPGRLPLSALNSSSPSASPENSMQMLDTMYPELSAQARTLNILRGNVNLGRATNENGASPPSVNPISGNKTINSSSTAFTKTDQKAKRISTNVLLPKSAKRLRLDTCSPDPSSLNPTVQQVSDDEPSNGVASPKSYPVNDRSSSSHLERIEGKTVDSPNDPQALILSAFEKLQNSYFDVLPVIRSHVFLGRISAVPVLRDEETSVISEFCLNQVMFFLFVFFNIILLKHMYFNGDQCFRPRSLGMSQNTSSVEDPS